MLTTDPIAAANQALWEREVKKGCGYTMPWLDLDVELVRRYAQGRLDPAPYPLYETYPPELLANVAGQDVLCLASGGGQQSAIMGLLGARMTVVDLAQGQLEGDQKAAAHYGYPVTTVQADMRDLSCLPEAAFDLVYQAESLSYVPDVRQVYGQVARLLRPCGLYRVKHSQPAIHRVTWDGQGYRIDRPYAERVYQRPDGGIEFRHYMDDLFNGLLDAGLSIRRVYEAPYARRPDPDAVPGTWDHEMAYVAGGFVIVARKE